MFQGIRRPFLFLLFLVVFFPSKAQKYNGNSPYSEFGLGDINPQGTLRNIGMAGGGGSLSSYEYIKNLNPALLPANKYMNFDSAAKNYTMLDAAGVFTMTKIQNNNNIGVDGSVYEAYLNLALPVSSKWVTNIGLQPYSLIDYQVASSKQHVANTDTNTVTYTYSGSGGLYKVFVSNGIDLTKNLSAGLEIGYLFGDGNHNSTSQIPIDFKYQLTNNYSSVYNGMSLKPGLAYRGKLNKSQKYIDSTVFFNIGVTAEIIPVLRVIDSDNFQRYDSLNNLLESYDVDHQVAFLRVPTTYRAGFSIDKPGKWNIGVDVNYTNWSNYKGLDSVNYSKLNAAYGIAIGGEYYMNAQEELRKKVIRAGFSYNKTPITLYNTVINDYSFTLGTTVPLGKIEAADRKRPLSKVNAALVFGNKGTTEMNLVKEFYFKVYLGFIINDRWFGRNKIE